MTPQPAVFSFGIAAIDKLPPHKMSQVSSRPGVGAGFSTSMDS
jgi:hypothetical protein